jgi:SET domain-containing protein
VTALKDIEADEELTSNYREFCDSCKKGDFGFVIK